MPEPEPSQAVFVKAFVAVIGEGASSPPTPRALSDVPATRWSVPGVALVTLGSSEPTIDGRLRATGDAAWIVGRPFALDDGSALRALDPTRGATVDRTMRQLDGRFRFLFRGADG